MVVFSASADKTIRMIDVYSGFKEMGVLKSTDAIFSIEALNNLLIAGTGRVLIINLIAKY